MICLQTILVRIYYLARNYSILLVLPAKSLIVKGKRYLDTSFLGRFEGRSANYRMYLLADSIVLLIDINNCWLVCQGWISPQAYLRGCSRCGRTGVRFKISSSQGCSRQQFIEDKSSNISKQTVQSRLHKVFLCFVAFPSTFLSCLLFYYHLI